MWLARGPCCGRRPKQQVSTQRRASCEQRQASYSMRRNYHRSRAWAATLLPDLAKRLTPIRSIAVYVAPPSELAADWAAAPCTMIETRESMLYALPPVPGAPLKLAGTANLRAADQNRPKPVSPKEARAVIDAFRPYLSNIDKYNIIGAAMGHYADPPDKTSSSS